MTRDECLSRIRAIGDDRAKALLVMLDELDEHSPPVKARHGRWRASFDGVRMRLVDCRDEVVVAEVRQVVTPHSAALWLAKRTLRSDSVGG